MGQEQFASYFVFLKVVFAGLFAMASLSACESIKRVINGDGLSSIARIRNPAVSGDPCGHADWFEVGRIDGLSGIKIDQSTYIGRCEARGTTVDRELYSAGWQRGLLEYCTPERGFDAGRSGQDYQGVCPSHVEAAFLKRFKVGAEIAAIDRKNTEIESQVDAKLRLLESLGKQTQEAQPTVLSDALRTDGPKERQKELQKELQRLRDLRARNDLEIKDLESISN
jgi:hypothetical protein